MRTLTVLVCLSLVALFVACEEPADDETSTEESEQTEEADEESDEESDEEARDDDEADDEEADGEEEELADDMSPGETKHFGAPFTIEDDPVDLSEALASLEDAEDGKIESIKVRADVQHVCQKKGCWMALSTEEADLPVRVHMEDYGFFVARNGAGADAIVEGSLQKATLTEEQARHFAEDLGEEDPDQIEGEEDNFQFMATGISMTLPES